MSEEFEKLRKCIFSKSERVVQYQTKLTEMAAIGPENNGQGETEKAAYIESLLCDMNFHCERLDAPDPRVRSGVRPNLIALRGGKTARTLWLFAHMDVVPAGDPASWRTEPFKVVREGDLLFGRGVEDNQQAICSMLILADSLHELEMETEFGLGLVFMSDEENGSEYGLKWILKEAAQHFKPADMYIVPDGGSQDGSLIEIAEKAQLWLKFTVLGSQCHASVPEKGKNSFIGASRLVLELHGLYDIFPQKNSLFRPPISTFTPTRHEENVEAINILPGKDVFYLDCRIVPGIELEKVCLACSEICSRVAEELGLKIRMDIVQRQEATMLPLDSPIIAILEKAIFNVYSVKARPVGIGGATVAAMLREKNLPAVVWSCLLNTCHQPNEHSSILATCRDAAVFAELLMNSQVEG